MRRSSLMAEGTENIVCTSPASSRPRRARASGAMTTFPPRLSGTKSSRMDGSKQTDVPASTPSSSRAPKTLEAHWTSATELRCSMATGFGRPVEPEVWIT